MKTPRSLALLLLGPALAFAAPAAQPAPDAAYVRVTTARAEKIVGKLHLPDAALAGHVRDQVAQFYRDLNAIQGGRDAAIKAAKQNATLDKAAQKAAIKAAQADADQRRETVRRAFVASLSAELTPEQVGAVEDGLTYGVAPLTYRVYLEMLPNLTAAQKDQIHAWLIEARGHAIAGFTSNEKHAWFGKYKGRINNYLAKAGINMKQAEHDFTARQSHR